MVDLLELPTELIVQILHCLTSADIRAYDYAVLRACKLFHNIAQTHMLKESILTVHPLHRYPPRLPAYYPYDHSHATSPLHAQLHSSVQTLMLKLQGPEEHTHFNTPCGVRFFCIHDQVDRYLAIDRWVKSLNTHIGELGRDLKNYNKLKSFHLIGQCAGCDPAVWRPWCKSGQAFLEYAQIDSLVTKLVDCRTLTSLTIDTADAEITPWAITSTARNDIHSCHNVAKLLRELPKLKTFKIRRRDICPAIFPWINLDESPDSTNTQACIGNDTSSYRSSPDLPNLETFLINLRLPETQRTSLDTWEAHSRHCTSTQHLWATHQMHHQNTTPQPQAQAQSQSQSTGVPAHFHLPNHPHLTFTTTHVANNITIGSATVSSPAHPSATLFDQMSSAATAFAHRHMSHTNKRVLVLSYERPAQDLPNYARRPCVANCVTGKKWTGLKPWDAANGGEMADGSWVGDWDGVDGWCTDWAETRDEVGRRRLDRDIPWGMGGLCDGDASSA